MAFRIDVTKELEYRGINSGVSQKTGKTWMSLRFEDRNAEQIEISVPQEMQGDVYSYELRKGDYCEVTFVAVARADGNSYLMLTALPEPVEDEE